MSRRDVAPHAGIDHGERASMQNGRKSRLVRLALAVVAGLVLGLGSAVGASYAAFRSGGVRVGAWSTNVDIGSAAAHPWLRMAVALGGFLALDRRETLYLTAFTDDEGRSLSRRCEYRLEGEAPRARWWSITAYGADSFLLPNEAHRYAIGARGETDGRISASLAPHVGEDVAIPLGDAPQSSAFSLTLRLYQPDASYVRDPESIRVPSLRMVRCH